MSVLSVRGVGKAFQTYKSEWHRVARWFGLPFIPSEENWVLRNISFEVSAGSAIGIIGKNGVGKSTLLKIIMGISKPTTGELLVNGRVSAILELGMGFHPDLTGRQNSYMVGQLQGMTTKEIDVLIDEINEFSGIGSYFDQPVRTYSSGMLARVAFSVATSSKFDILIIDEVLSVGDIAFQAKCMQRMSMILNNGSTIIFVSHGIDQIRQFCSKAIYIANGELKSYGDSSSVCDSYKNDLALESSTITSTENKAFKPSREICINKFQIDKELRKNSVDELSGNKKLEFTAFEVYDERKKPISACNPNTQVLLVASIFANSAVPSGSCVGLLIADKSGYPLLSCNTNDYSKSLPSIEIGERIVVHWSLKIPFYSGEFRIDIGIKPEPFSSEFYDRVFCARTLSVNTPSELLKKNFGGLLHVPADIQFIKQ